MRIGAFAKKNGISIETVRHYMDMGLIVPVKVGGQYSFKEICQRDLDLVLTFKNMGFTLREIRRIMHFRVISQLNVPSELDHYKSYFENNLKRLENELSKLEQAKNLVEESLKSLSRSGKVPNNKKEAVIGVPLSALALLACPECGKDLTLSEGTITSGKIMNGCLICACGCRLEINDGILDYKTIQIESEFWDKDDERVSYYESTSEEFVSNLYATSRWLPAVGKVVEGNGFFKDLKGKVILEPGVGIAYALSQYAHLLEPSTVYIAIDHNIDKLRYTQKYLAKAGIQCALLLLGAELDKLPLKPNIADIVMDMAGSSNVAFLSNRFLLKTIDKHLKRRVQLMGTYILCEGFKTEDIPKENHRLFKESVIRQEIEALGYRVVAEYTTAKITEGGPYEPFLDMVETTSTYCCYADRK